MGERPDPPEASGSINGLERLANAYGIEFVTPRAVADAIAAAVHLDHGSYERDTVIDLVIFIVDHEDVLSALERCDELSAEIMGQMANLVADDPPATAPEWEFLQDVLENVRSTLRPPRGQSAKR